MSALTVSGLTYSYPDGTPALRGIDLHIEQGERICLAGPNGAGKSTLLHGIAGLLKAKGEGFLTKPDPARFGLVFQYPDDQLFCSTVAEDVAFGPRNQRKNEDVIKEKVRKVLEAVELAGFDNRAAHHLSGGEKKRAAMAAVLACDPAILALDEPWANLDARACRAVTKILQDFRGTLIVASHELRRAASVCSRLIVLDQGKIVADGKMTDILKNEEFLIEHGLENA